MNCGAYYHWWDTANDCPPYKNLHSPILLSIATLRAVSPDLPITVFKNELEKDWAHFPEKLKFDVVPIPFTLEERHSDKRGWRYLSRLFDLELRAKHDTVIYVDADVFWLKNPLPLLGDTQKFCFNGFNTGFFYYDRTSQIVQRFFEIFKAITIGALYDEAIRHLINKHVGYESWHYVFDEQSCTYLFHEHPDLFSQIPVAEHACTRDLMSTNIDDIRMLHCNGLMVANEYAKDVSEREHCRGLCCLIIKEFYDIIREVLDDDDLAMIFTERERSFFINNQISLKEEPNKLLSTRSHDGHFHLRRCLKTTKIFS